MSRWRCLVQFLRAALDPGEVGLPAAEVVPPDLTAPTRRVAECVSAAREALGRDDVEACAEAASAALAESPGDLLAAFFLGQALWRQGRLEEAREAFQAAAKGDPFGLSAGWLRSIELAIEARARARPRPETQAAIELESAARRALRQQDWETGRALAAEAVEHDPANLLAWHLLGQALLGQQRVAEAIAAYEAARPHAGPLGLVDEWIATARRQGAGEKTREP